MFAWVLHSWHLGVDGLLAYILHTRVIRYWYINRSSLATTTPFISPTYLVAGINAEWKNQLQHPCRCLPSISIRVCALALYDVQGEIVSVGSSLPLFTLTIFGRVTVALRISPFPTTLRFLMKQLAVRKFREHNMFPSFCTTSFFPTCIPRTTTVRMSCPAPFDLES